MGHWKDPWTSPSLHYNCTFPDGLTDHGRMIQLFTDAVRCVLGDVICDFVKTITFFFPLSLRFLFFLCVLLVNGCWLVAFGLWFSGYGLVDVGL
jgi:hypothetical protein